MAPLFFLISKAAKRPRGSSFGLDHPGARCVEPGSMCGVVRGFAGGVFTASLDQGHRKTYKTSWRLPIGHLRCGRRLLWRTKGA